MATIFWLMKFKQKSENKRYTMVSMGWWVKVPKEVLGKTLWWDIQGFNVQFRSWPLINAMDNLDQPFIDSLKTY